MRKRRVSAILSEKWQPTILGMVAVVLVLGLLLIRIDSIAATAIAPQELYVLDKGFSYVMSHPLYLHEQLTQKMLSAIGVKPVYALRAAAIVSGFAAVFALHYILKKWFTRRTALLGTVLFATSSWFLHVVRIGTTDSSYILFLLPIAALVMLYRNNYSLSGALLLLGSYIVLLYVPGMIWLLTVLAVWQKRRIKEAVKNMPLAGMIVTGLGLLMGIVPLIVAIVQDQHFVWQLLAVPTSLAHAAEIPAYFLSGVRELFFLRETNHLLGIAQLPYINIATSMLVVLGLVKTYRKRTLDRSKALFALSAVGLTLHAISRGEFSLVFMLPLIYVYAAAGLVFLFRRWLTVFPRNPLAEKVGLLCLVLVIVSISTYELTRYFVAWPHSDGYTEVFGRADT